MPNVYASTHPLVAHKLSRLRDKKTEPKKFRELISELAMLRLQLNPHFLFNTLHNIDALIKREPDTASSLLIRLSAMMRYMFYESQDHKVLLPQEIDYIHNYISLQKLRY